MYVTKRWRLYIFKKQVLSRAYHSLWNESVWLKSELMWFVICLLYRYPSAGWLGIVAYWSNQGIGHLALRWQCWRLTRSIETNEISARVSSESIEV